MITGQSARRAVVAMVVAALLVASVAVAAEVRTWRDSSGSFSRDGEFVRLDGDVVVLRLAGGREIRVPLAKLSEADRTYVASITERPSAPKPDPAKPAATSPGETTPDASGKPLVRITVRSYQALLDAGSYLGDALKQPLVAMALPTALTAATGGKSLAGFDAKRPLVAIVPVIDGQPTDMVVFLPFKSAKQARETLQGMFGGGREVDGLVEVAIPGIAQPVLVRCDDEHAVLSTSAAALAAASVPTGPNPVADISVRVNSTAVSDTVVATMIEHARAAESAQRTLVERQLASGPQGQVAVASGLWAFDAVSETTRTLFTDAETFRLDATIDKKAGKIALDMALLAKPGTSLAGMMERFAAVDSPFAAPSGAEVFDCVVSVPLNQKARDLIATTVQPAFGKVRELMAPLAAQPGGETAVRAVEAAMVAARDVFGGDRLDQRVSLFAAQQGGMQTLVMVHGEKAVTFGGAFEAAARALPQLPGLTITPAVKEGQGFRSHALTPGPGPNGAAAPTGPMHLACGTRALALTMGPESLAMGEWALAQPPGGAKRGAVALRIDPGRFAAAMPPALFAAGAALPGLAAGSGGLPPAGALAGPAGDNYSNSIRGRADGIAQATQSGTPIPGADDSATGGSPTDGNGPSGGGYPGGGYPGGGYPGGGVAPIAGGNGGGVSTDAISGLPSGSLDVQIKPIRRGIQFDLDVEDGALRAIGELIARLATMVPPPAAQAPANAPGVGGVPIAPGAAPSPAQPGGVPTIIPPTSVPPGGFSPSNGPPATAPSTGQPR